MTIKLFRKSEMKQAHILGENMEAKTRPEIKTSGLKELVGL